MPHKDPEAARMYFRERGRKERAKNPERFNAAARRHYTKHRDKIRAAYDSTKHREWWLKRNYGLSLEAWEALFNGQGRCCAICGKSDPGSKKGWSTDHDHETGRVRGILCMSCNTFIGLLGDTYVKAKARVERMLEYLR
jgi:recombination endonuclease VII